MIDQDMMRIRNLSQVLECIRTSGGPCTKRGIQAGTGLSWASASGLTEELIQQGYVIETTRRSENSLGRPAKAYDINPRRNLYIGVDINVESLHLAVIDLKCRLLYTESKMLVEYERDSIVGMVKEMIRRALDSGPVNAGEVKGVGFALMSVVDIENGVAVYSQHFKDWKNVSIRRIFEDEFRLPVLVEHDPTCLAIAEMNLGHGKFNSKVVYLRVSLGIGVSIVLDGRIYKGANGSSGEFGHMCVDLDGPLCSCGKRGCIEAYASVSGMAARYREDVKKQAGYSGFSERSVEGDIAVVNKLAKAALNKDAAAQRYFDAAAGALGIGIGNLISLLNPDKVIIGGIFTEFERLYMKTLMDTVGAASWPYFTVDIVNSNMPPETAAIGAASLFIQQRVWENRRRQ